MLGTIPQRLHRPHAPGGSPVDNVCCIPALLGFVNLTQVDGIGQVVVHLLSSRQRSTAAVTAICRQGSHVCLQGAFNAALLFPACLAGCRHMTPLHSRRDALTGWQK